MKKNKYLILFPVLLIWVFYYADSVHGQSDTTSQYFSLFTDHKSLQVDDIVTIYIMEFSSGSNQASTKTRKKGTVGLDLAGSGSMAGVIPSMGGSLSRANEFDGQGSVSQKANLQAKISARIVERLPNSNLMIKGKREVNVNGDKQIIELSGIVRPQDINSGNVIYSYNISDAKISYKGKGPLNQGQKHGWIYRIIHWFF